MGIQWDTFWDNDKSIRIRKITSQFDDSAFIIDTPNTQEPTYYFSKSQRSYELIFNLDWVVRIFVPHTIDPVTIHCKYKTEPGTTEPTLLLEHSIIASVRSEDPIMIYEYGQDYVPLEGIMKLFCLLGLAKNELIPYKKMKFSDNLSFGQLDENLYFKWFFVSILMQIPIPLDSFYQVFEFSSNIC